MLNNSGPGIDPWSFEITSSCVWQSEALEISVSKPRIPLVSISKPAWNFEKIAST